MSCGFQHPAVEVTRYISYRDDTFIGDERIIVAQQMHGWWSISDVPMAEAIEVDLAYLKPYIPELRGTLNPT